MNSKQAIFVTFIGCHIFSITHSLKIIKTIVPTCSVTTDQGTIDLKPLAKNDGKTAGLSATYSPSKSMPTITFYWNPCFEFSMPSGGTSDTKCSNTEVCAFTEGDYSGIGPKANAKFVVVDTSLALEYSIPQQPLDPEQTEFSVTLQCDHNANSPSFSITRVDPSGGGFQAQLKSVHACPTKASSLSTGSILIIITVSLLFVYLLAGVIILKFAKHAEGLEIIPNYSFWKSVPGYVKDGAKFTASGFKKLPTDSNYESI